MLMFCVIVSPPVFSSAVIWGTVPVWCSASSVNPGVADTTPGSFATWLSAWSGKLRRVADRKKSWVNFVPGLPSFDRSVVTLELPR